jgi:dipeptidyl aminopeptidase/acylaminoacyl peptidase
MAIKLEQLPGSDDSTEREQPSLLRRRSRSLAVAVVAVVAAVIGVSLALTGGGPEEQSEASDVDVVARPDQSPPRELIAAGQVAVSAYYTTKLVQQPDGDAVNAREWNLYNAATKRYEKTDWAWLDVAPGMKTAAVLEGDLPANRIGLMNLSTGKVQRWIEVDKGVGGVQFSPDGERLVATTYSHNPDGLFQDAPVRVQGASESGDGQEMPGPKQSRTGFYVIDVDSGRAEFSERPAKKDSLAAMAGTGRQDFSWSRDGELLWEQRLDQPGRNYYDVDGRLKSLPRQKTDLIFPPVATSPDGKLVTGGFAGGKDGQIVSAVLDAKTGERSAVVPGQQLLAWADNTHLIAWRCDPSQCKPGKGEFRNQLVLVSLEGDKVTPLSGFRKAKADYVGRWNPVFTKR